MPDALATYREGFRIFADGQADAAIAKYREALAIDPQLAIAATRTQHARQRRMTGSGKRRSALGERIVERQHQHVPPQPAVVHAKALLTLGAALARFGEAFARGPSDSPLAMPVIHRPGTSTTVSAGSV